MLKIEITIKSEEHGLVYDVTSIGKGLEVEEVTTGFILLGIINLFVKDKMGNFIEKNPALLVAELENIVNSLQFEG